MGRFEKTIDKRKGESKSVRKVSSAKLKSIIDKLDDKLWGQREVPLIIYIHRGSNFRMTRIDRRWVESASLHIYMELRVEFDH
jgi:hypothetical protein